MKHGFQWTEECCTKPVVLGKQSVLGAMFGCPSKSDTTDLKPRHLQRLWPEFYLEYLRYEIRGNIESKIEASLSDVQRFVLYVL